MSRRRIVLTVAYDGTDFRGFAAQLGSRTVQGTLKEAVRQISGEDVEILGASRTDSGAHARGQVVAFDTDNPMPAERWSRVLNRVLPADLSATVARLGLPDFHPRFMATDRRYRYRILTGPPDPHRARFVHGWHRPLDVAKMDEAAQRLRGSHDFRAYTEELDPSVENTRRTLFSVGVRPVRDEVWVDVVGTAFLRGMMRRMAGALLEVGRGGRPVVEVSGLLDPEERNSLRWPQVLPACGLCLEQIRYGRHPRDHRAPPTS